MLCYVDKSQSFNRMALLLGPSATALDHIHSKCVVINRVFENKTEDL
jgi:hypothetical protein